MRGHSLAEQLVVLRVERNVVLVYVLIQTFSAQHLGDLDELVVVVVSMEEWLLPEYLD